MRDRFYWIRCESECRIVPLLTRRYVRTCRFTGIRAGIIHRYPRDFYEIYTFIRHYYLFGRYIRHILFGPARGIYVDVVVRERI